MEAILLYFQFSNISLLHVIEHFSIITQRSWDTEDGKKKCWKAILHIWISPHQVKMVNLNTKIQFALHPYLLQRTHIHFQPLKVKTKASITRTVSVWRIWKQSFHNISSEGKQGYSKFIEIIKFTSTQQIWYHIISHQQCSHLLRISLWFKAAIHYEALALYCTNQSYAPLLNWAGPQPTRTVFADLSSPSFLWFNRQAISYFSRFVLYYQVRYFWTNMWVFKSLPGLPRALPYQWSLPRQQGRLMTRKADQLRAFLLMNPTLPQV